MTETFLGLPLDCLDFEESIRRLVDAVEARRGGSHLCLNAAKFVACKTDPTIAQALAEATLVSADGMSIVWAGRLMRTPIPERVTGIDLFERLLEEAELRSWRVYLLGATESTLHQLHGKLLQRHPHLQICGSQHGYWSLPDEAVIRSLIATAPDICFLALPSPRKEQLIVNHRALWGSTFTFGVGGSFDVLSGRTRRAPRWMQASGLEWCYRLAQEPRRMAKRYLIGNFRFVFQVIVELMKQPDQKRK